ncbi:MAG TPA: M24 family metallopeptidase [Candidatus Deferrimicrobium sp.]|nr:M24 family metallopeptidase [Candidatus Deferrimicrobium sp.]
MDLSKIQEYLKEQELHGWLLADFHGRNTVAVQLLGLTGIVTRRSFYFIPQSGPPTALVHAIEKSKFANLPGEIIPYSGYRQLEQELGALLSGCQRVAMEYSPHGRLPYVGLVDAGTIELVRQFGVDVVSSADLVADFQARLSAEQIAAHRIAANNLMEIKDKTFAHIAALLMTGTHLTEYDVVRFMLERFKEYDMRTDFAPICAVDDNAGDPHYEPAADSAAKIAKGQLVLIDLWAKIKHAAGVYADITWVAFAGSRGEVPNRYGDVFQVLVDAREEAVAFVRDNVEKRPVYGYQVDDVCRNVVREAGYGEFFTHRTGHSITGAEHGPGPNIDNLETEDRRKLQRGHLFSIEPGIYLPQFGLRTEINMLIGHNGAEVTTLPVQTTIVPLL